MRPAFLKRLVAALDSPDDTRFAAAADALSRIGEFPPPAGPPEVLDRYRCVSLAIAAERRPEAIGQRLRLLDHFIRIDRDNPHVRRALSLATSDGEASVRAASAMLAGRLADDQALAALLDDKSPAVQAAAALDAGLAGRTALVERIAGLLAATGDDDAKASAAYALARLDPKAYTGAICRAMLEAHQSGRKDLLGKLLYAACVLSPPPKEGLVVDILPGSPAEVVLGIFEHAYDQPEEGGSGAQPPFESHQVPIMALVAAGRMRIAAAGDHALAAIANILGEDKSQLTAEDAQRLAAAVRAAGRLGAEPGLIARAMRELWGTPTTLAMVLASEALADMASDSGKTDMTTDEIAAHLARAAAYNGDSLPSAAAAVSLFRLRPERAGAHLLTACESSAWLVGDYVAWRMAHGPHREQAWAVAESLAATEQRNDAARSAGTLLLAMLARDGDRAGQVRQMIEQRLRGGPYGPLRDPYLGASYKCGLLILGQREYADDVFAFAQGSDFPWSRALTALTLAGDARGPDTALGRSDAGCEQIDSFLTGWMMCRPYAQAIPDLPAFDLEAPAAVRYWQCRILRDYYLIHRRAILDRMGP